MNATLIPQALAVLVAAALSAACAVLAFRRRPARGAVFLGWAMLGLAVWAAADVLSLWLSNPGSLPWPAITRYLGAATLPVAWYGLVVAFADDGQRPTPTVLTRLGVVPLLTVLLAGTNAQHGLLWSGPDGGGAAAPGVWFWAHVVYGCGVTVAGWGALVRAGLEARGSAHGPLWMLAGVGAAALLASVFGPWLGMGWGLVAVHLALAGCGGLLLWTLFRQRPADLLLLVEEAFGSHESEAVLALDSHDRVVDANAPALLLLAEHGVWEAVGRRACHVLAGPLAPLVAVGTDGAVTLAADGGQRTIRSRELPLGSDAGPWRARALVLQDVTTSQDIETQIPTNRQSATRLRPRWTWREPADNEWLHCN